MLSGGLALTIGLALLPGWFVGAARWNPWIQIVAGVSYLMLGWALRRGYRLARAGCVLIWVVVATSLIVVYVFGAVAFGEFDVRRALVALGGLGLCALFVWALFRPDSNAFFARGPRTSAEDKRE